MKHEALQTTIEGKGGRVRLSLLALVTQTDSLTITRTLTRSDAIALAVQLIVVAEGDLSK